MSEFGNIKVHNIYYMLVYAGAAVNLTEYQKLEKESFDNGTDLLAAVLLKGIGAQLQKGLKRGYCETVKAGNVLRGRLNLSASIGSGRLIKGEMICSYDEFTENIYCNRIIKTTAVYLCRCGAVALERRQALKRLLWYFSEVDLVKPQTVKWEKQNLRGHERSYQFLINICRFILEGMLPQEYQGSQQLRAFRDPRRMHRLFEQFVLGYFKHHYPGLQPKASKIDWNVDDENRELLPQMHTDITLSTAGQELIIDTKFYQKELQETYYGTVSQHSANLYQIYSYVKNKDRNQDGSVSGMLLYAKTSARQRPDQRYLMGGNAIYVRSLDLAGEFSEIERQLCEISELLRIN